MLGQKTFGKNGKSISICWEIYIKGWDIFIWLVVEPTPLKNMSSSIGMMNFPLYGKNMFQTTNKISISMLGQEIFIISISYLYHIYIISISYLYIYIYIISMLGQKTFGKNGKSISICWEIYIKGWDIFIWLVVEPTPLKNMSSSIGMMNFPLYGKNMFQTTNKISISMLGQEIFIISKSYLCHIYIKSIYLYLYQIYVGTKNLWKKWEIYIYMLGNLYQRMGYLYLAGG